MNIQHQKAANYSSLISDRRRGRAGRRRCWASTTRRRPSPASCRRPRAGDSSQISVTASAGTPTEARDLANAAVEALGEVVHELENAGLPDGSRRRQPGAASSPAKRHCCPALPSSPDYQRNLLVGAGAGLAAGLLPWPCGGAPSTARSARWQNVEEAGVGAVIGIIPSAGALSRSSRGVSEDLGVAAEAFRQLRTNLRFVDVDNATAQHRRDQRQRRTRASRRSRPTSPG